jgi:hypothetical protein
MAANTTTTKPDTEAESTAREIVSATREMATEVADKASSVAARLPEAAATTRGAVDEAARRMEASSDQMLAVGAALSLGLAIGMLVGGANRMLVALALIPATAMGFTLLDRTGGARTGGRRSN